MAGMRLTYKYRLSPNSSQRRALQHLLDGCRWVYNQTLEVRQKAYKENGEKLGRYATYNLLPQWKCDQPSLQDMHAQTLQDAQRRVDLAFRAFFRRVKAGEAPGYPRFKGKGHYDSFTYPQQKGNWRLLDHGCLRLSKVGDVKIKVHRSIEGVQKTLTIRRDSVGNWYACFACEVETKPLPTIDKIVGVDLGLKMFAFPSDGSRIRRQRWMKRDTKDIARLQRKKEQFPKCSPEHHKAILALCHAYRRATNRRNNFAHQASRNLVNTYQIMVFEDLDIRDMQSDRQRVINRNIADVAWGQFVQYTTYKAANAGRSVVRVNPRGTTQICSGCGELVPKDLSVRVHQCPYCGLTIDRDLNAALNIVARGLASLGARPRSSRIHAGE